MSLPKQLKAWRRREKLTQQTAAAKLGASRRTYEKWEQGTNAPRGFALAALIQRTK